MKYIIPNHYKTKEQLDNMSDHQIEDFRDIFLTKLMIHGDVNDNHYLSEFQVYNEIRFKERTMETFDLWMTSDKKEHYFMKRVLIRLGKEKMYNFGLLCDVDKVSEFIYIHNIDIPEKI